MPCHSSPLSSEHPARLTPTLSQTGFWIPGRSASGRSPSSAGLPARARPTSSTRFATTSPPKSSTSKAMPTTAAPSSERSAGLRSRATSTMRTCWGWHGAASRRSGPSSSRTSADAAVKAQRSCPALYHPNPGKYLRARPSLCAFDSDWWPCSMRSRAQVAQRWQVRCTSGSVEAHALGGC